MLTRTLKSIFSKKEKIKKSNSNGTETSISGSPYNCSKERPEKQNNARQKEEIEQLQKKINNMLKNNPDAVKKASLIISSMIKEEKDKKSA